jgi:methionine-rich copper-binding protein CopC
VLKRSILLVGAVLILVAMNTGIVSAHASLVSATIKSGQVFHVGQTPKLVKALFAEPLDPAKSWIAVFENQADHGLVTDKQHSVVNFKNPKEMDLALPKIDKGKYYLMWYTHSAADGHFAAGVRYFQVR